MAFCIPRAGVCPPFLPLHCAGCSGDPGSQLLNLSSPETPNPSLSCGHLGALEEPQRIHPPFPRDPHMPGAGPGWDPSSHQFRPGASSCLEGVLMREGLPCRREPLFWSWAVSPLQGPHFGGAAGRAGGSCPLWDLEHASSRGRASPKPSLPFPSWRGFPGLCGAVFPWWLGLGYPRAKPHSQPPQSPLGPC